MTNACRACNKSISCNGLTCADCAQSFHGKCVFKAGTDDLTNSKTWKCEKCVKKEVRAAPNVQAHEVVQPQKPKKIARATNVNDVYSMFLELKKDLKTFQTGLVDSIKRLHAKIESNAKRFDDQSQKLTECFEIIRCLKKENEDLRNDIDAIKKKQTEADQKNRQNDLEIRGIPLQPNENVVGILQSLALALRSPLMIDGHCIVFCYRARPKDDGSPGTIHVRFSHHVYKDDLLRRRCAYGGFNSCLMSLPVTSHMSVFVNESLCPERRVLFKMANEMRREKKYRYIWTREGRILLRKSDYCQVIAINCLADLNKL